MPRHRNAFPSARHRNAQSSDAAAGLPTETRPKPRLGDARPTCARSPGGPKSGRRPHPIARTLPGRVALQEDVGPWRRREPRARRPALPPPGPRQGRSGPAAARWHPPTPPHQPKRAGGRRPTKTGRTAPLRANITLQEDPDLGGRFRNRLRVDLETSTQRGREPLALHRGGGAATWQAAEV